MAEKELWQSVIYQAMIDATAPKPKRPDPIGVDASDRENKRYGHAIRSYREKLEIAADAKEWLTRAGRDFRLVCSQAGMDADFLSNAFMAGRINRDFLKSAEPKVAAE